MTPLERYDERASRFGDAAAALKRRADRLSTVRLVVFGLMIAAAATGEETGSAFAWTVALLLASAFVALILFHRRARAAGDWQEALAANNRLGRARLQREWSALPVLIPPATPDPAGYARDLDLFGSPSLSQLLGPARTATGRQTVTRWLLQPASPAEVARRQPTVRALAPENDWRDAFAARASMTSSASLDELRSFFDWAEGEPWLLRRPALVWAVRLLPLLTIGLGVARLTDALGMNLWIAPLAAAALLTYGSYGRRVHAIFQRAASREGMLSALPDLLAHAATLPGDAPLAADLRARLTSESADAARRLHDLERILHLADLRFSGTMHPPVQLLTLWDFHVLARLERWQRAHGRRVRDWLVALGEVEALCALATLAHDEPDWAFPVVSAACDTFDARALGHPMLRRDARVANDVVVGPPGTVLLVTGSNMSGKSTLLRALGTNAVLAQAGAPVCAESLRMPPLDIRTSVHIDDSLAGGVSLFRAELERMRGIVEAARTIANRRATSAAITDGAGDRDGAEPVPRLFYLLDEMLHGTNTAERRIAARTVVEHLLEQGAIGAITTHDLALAEEPVIAQAAACIHFREQVSRDENGVRMTFDYRARPGLATSTNALTLLEIVGLGRGAREGKLESGNVVGKERERRKGEAG